MCDLLYGDWLQFDDMLYIDSGLTKDIESVKAVYGEDMINYRSV